MTSSAGARTSNVTRVSETFNSSSTSVESLCHVSSLYKLAPIVRRQISQSKSHRRLSSVTLLAAGVGLIQVFSDCSYNKRVQQTEIVYYKL